MGSSALKRLHHPEGKHQYGANEFKNSLDGETDYSERQQQKPDQRKEEDK